MNKWFFKLMVILLFAQLGVMALGTWVFDFSPAQQNVGWAVWFIVVVCYWIGVLYDAL